MFEGEACGESEIFEDSAGLLLGGAGLTSVFLSGAVDSLDLGAGKGGNWTHSLSGATGGLFRGVLLAFLGGLSSVAVAVGAAGGRLV